MLRWMTCHPIIAETLRFNSFLYEKKCVLV
uniref:Uncharacterized protein n=1 Tax=Rhizophora mucronata TaxID=61149 RepID=A0A2P2P6J3_RHIMU